METGVSSIYRYKMEDYINWGSGVFFHTKLVPDDCPLHWHDHFEVEYILSGHGRQIFNGVEYEIKPGMLHLLAPTDFHEWIVDGDVEVAKINFREEDVDPFILNTLIGLCGNTALPFQGKQKEIFDRLFEVSMQQTALFKDTDYGNMMFKRLLECIILNIIEHLKNSMYSREISFEKTTDNIRRVTMYIHQHFKEPLELKSVAEFVHYSPQYLSKIFHQVMGVTFKDYITNLRMNYASALIINTDMSISDICTEAGFGTRRNFTKEFKRIYFYSPTEYRQKNQKLNRNNNPYDNPPKKQVVK